MAATDIPLRAIRSELGISQGHLARRMGLAQSHVSRVERGLVPSWPKFRRDAAAALGIDESRLFGDGRDPDPAQPHVAVPVAGSAGAGGPT